MADLVVNSERQRNVLMACGHYWTSPLQVGSHHLARAFAKQGWNVGYVSDPISPLHVMGSRPVLAERYRTYRTGGRVHEDVPLWSYVPGTLVAPQNRPLLRSEWVHRHWWQLSSPNVVSKVREAGFGEAEVIYLDAPVQKFWLEEVRHRRSVYRVADTTSGFSKFTPAVERLEHELAQAVDLVVYTAHGLREYVERMRPRRMEYLPNGVNFDHFANGDRTMPAEYGSIGRPIVLYIGAMDVWFDYELVNRSAEAIPEASFVLIGPDKLARERIRPRANVHILGRREYAKLPAYLHNADVGIIPFDVASHPTLVNNVSPLKLLEYMACGLPVVSVEWEELKRMATPAVLTRSAEAFVEAIRAAIDRPGDRGALVEFARGADWGNRLRMMLGMLGLSA